MRTSAYQYTKSPKAGRIIISSSRKGEKGGGARLSWPRLIASASPRSHPTMPSNLLTLSYKEQLHSPRPPYRPPSLLPGLSTRPPSLLRARALSLSSHGSRSPALCPPTALRAALAALSARRYSPSDWSGDKRHCLLAALQESVASIETMEAVMRHNDYKHDVLDSWLGL